jgi:hypothetical protein
VCLYTSLKIKQRHQSSNLGDDGVMIYQ